MSDEFNFLADQTERAPAFLDFPHASAIRTKYKSVRSMLKAAAQVQLAPHRHAGPFQ